MGNGLRQRAHDRRALVRTLTVVDIYTREALALVADRSLTGLKVAAALSTVLQSRMPSPKASTAGGVTNLNSHVFGNVAEAQALLDAWRDDYNRVRPHSALQDRTPVEWAQYVTVT